MNQVEIIGPKIQGNCSFEIGQFLGEGQGKPVKSSNLHSERQILAFDVRSANLAVIRNAKDFGNFRSRHTRRRVATSAWVLRCVKLRDLGNQFPTLGIFRPKVIERLIIEDDAPPGQRNS